MNAKLQTDMIAIFAAGFIASALVTSGAAGLLEGLGFTAARILGSVSVESAIALLGGVMSVMLNRRTSKVH
jgi:hypothetical protein